MKKILFWILTFLWIWLSFCSASVCDDIDVNWHDCWSDPNDTWCILWFWCNGCFSSTNSWYDCYEQWWTQNWFDCVSTFNYIWNSCTTFWSNIINWWWSSSPSSSDIDVYYNNWNSVENITCDWTQAISINWLSTITSTNTFTPYYNISYTDEDNQKLTESYSKDILYLENWQFKKTYTWNNDWILTVQWSSDSTFTWYVPVFDFTGDTIVNTWNLFNNFSDNALKVLLSNIPSYIQYITIFAILVFLFSFIRRFKRKS